MKNYTDKKKRGLLIVFEGVDRAGKSTQVKMLKEYFEGTKQGKSEEMRFPNRGTKIGKEINEILKNYKNMESRATHLLFSINRWEQREEILNKLENGIHCILDRYAFSGIVYSIANGVDAEWCKHPDQGLPRPDLVFQIDVDVSKASSRENFGAEIYEKTEFQEKVRQEFKRFHGYKYWRVVNGEQSKEMVNTSIISEVELLLKQYDSSEMDEFNKNFYPYSIGEDLFMFKDI